MMPTTATWVTMDWIFGPRRKPLAVSEKTTISRTRNTRAGASGRISQRRTDAPSSGRPSATSGGRASLMSGTPLLNPTTSGLLLAIGRSVSRGAGPHPRGRSHHALLGRLFSVELARDPALAHDHHPVAHRKDLLKLGGY